MAKYRVLLIGGSPSASSRSTQVLRVLGERLVKGGADVGFVSLGEFEPTALLFGRKDPSIVAFLDQVRAADGIACSTPVYKATYSGALKTVLDLIDRGGLVGKRTLGIATARLSEHRASVSRSFEDLWHFFEGSIGLPSVTLLDAQLGTKELFELDTEGSSLVDEAAERLRGNTG